MSERNEQSLLFIRLRHRWKIGFFFSKKTYFPSRVHNMFRVTIWYISTMEKHEFTRTFKTNPFTTGVNIMHFEHSPASQSQAPPPQSTFDNHFPRRIQKLYQEWWTKKEGSCYYLVFVAIFFQNLNFFLIPQKSFDLIDNESFIN